MLEVIKRAKKFGIKFNKNKVQFKVTEVKYIGQIFSSKGVSPDPQYIEAILKIKEPKTKKELLRIMGMLNYLTKYIPRLSELVAPLRGLLKEKTEFKWTIDHSLALNNIKSLITKIPNLKIFDSNDLIEIQTDASQFGIGGCLLQKGHPVAFCSRSLTETEIRYPQIDKELLSICFTLNKFHNFIYGRKIKIKTDHKPLVTICSKYFYKVTARIQRLKLKLLKYNYTIEYLPGKLMYIADLLSRSFIKTADNVTEVPEQVHCVDLEVPLSDATVYKLKQAIANDVILTQIKEYCENGWPEKCQGLSYELAVFFKLKDSLYSKNDLLFLDNKLVIPKSLRKDMLNKLHVAHLGIQKTKSRTRNIFYWPRMTVDIDDFISKCSACLKYSRNVIKEPLIAHERPKIPFAKVGTDILTFGGRDYLVIVDYFSNWIELGEINSKSALEIINILRKVFATYGIPVTVIADNNPFGSLEFRKFAKDWDFNIINSSPRYPKSNGMAEKAVGICKNMLRKCQETNTDVYKALLEYRNTPLAGLNISPAELLNKRLLRTTLPVSNKILNDIPEIDYKKLSEHRNKAKVFYDRQAKERREFRVGDSVILKKEKYWVPAEVIDITEKPRSYIVKDNVGRIYRRNSTFIKASPNQYKQEKDTSIPSIETEMDTMPIASDRQNLVQSKDTSVKDSQPEIGKTVSRTDDSCVKTRSGRIVNKPSRYKE